MVAILVAAMCALIRENGGFDVLLNVIHRIFRGKRGGQFGVGLLVTLLDIATANNTVEMCIRDRYSMKLTPPMMADGIEPMTSAIFGIKLSITAKTAAIRMTRGS